MAKIILSVFLILFTAVSVHASDMRVMGHRIPPFAIHSEDDQVIGFSADLFKMVYQNLNGPDADIDITPTSFKRLYVELQNAKRRIGITIGRNTKREMLFKWVGPYLVLDLGVIAKKERHFDIKTIDDFKDYKIATIENTVPEQTLLELGLSLESIQRDIYPEKNITQLHNGHVDFFAYPLQAASYIMKVNQINPKQYEEVFHLRTIEIYFAFSRDFSDDEISAYQVALDQVMQTEKFLKLKKLYSLDGISSQHEH